ncbi:uncharacterized protein LOC111330348 [Stylophora pistillata]|uniref:uncharacterized protein LOC111330348 n=1 Tax=Stylophora pistillata TaxID=50429 RepID=UPI000C045D7B|nr:uncharacterized protein LOC111330348 [Stylophora pistillata]
MIRQTVIRTPLQITPPTSKVTTSSGAKTTQGISVRYSSLIVTVAQNTSSSGKAATSIPSHVGNSGLRNASAFYNSTQGPATAISFEISCASSGNGFNTTQVTPSEKKFKVRIANNDNIANHSGQEGGQNLKKTQQPDEGGIQQIQEFFKSKGCIPASFDEEVEEFIFKNPADTQESMKHDQVLNTIETTLMSISITAEVISFAFLSVIRVPKSERIFVHKNLLVSLALGQLVYVLDVNNFPTRNVHHTICSAISVIQHYLHTSLYTWMLVEAINLYAKIVKVFTFGKSYATYTMIGWGIPGVIVGLVAAIQPSTYDMSTILYKNITCGTLKLTGTVDRERCWLNGNVWKFKGPVLAMLLVRSHHLCS